MTAEGERVFVVLGIDLAWSGPSGAAVLTVRRGERTRASMTILSPFRPPARRKNEVTGEYHVRVAVALSRWIASLVEAHQPKVVAVEVSDWHQPFGRRAGGRERVVQRALGRAEGVVALTVGRLRSSYPNLVFMELGAKQVKRVVCRNANASKEDMMRAIRSLFPALPRPRAGEPLDGYDAAALAFAAARLFARAKRGRAP